LVPNVVKDTSKTISAIALRAFENGRELRKRSQRDIDLPFDNLAGLADTG
jgi:hypothetical protein